MQSSRRNWRGSVQSSRRNWRSCRSMPQKRHRSASAASAERLRSSSNRSSARPRRSACWLRGGGGRGRCGTCPRARSIRSRKSKAAQGTPRSQRTHAQSQSAVRRITRFAMLVVAALPGPCGVACRAQGTRDGTCTGAPSCGRRRARSSSGWAGALTRARAVTMVSLPHDPVRAFGCSGSWGGIEGSGETLSPMAVVARATGTPTGAFRQGWGTRQGGKKGRKREGMGGTGRREAGTPHELCIWVLLCQGF